MNGAIITAIFILAGGILMLLLRNQSQGFMGAVMGYGKWGIDSPHLFKKTYFELGKISIAYALSFGALIYVSPEWIEGLTAGVPHWLLLFLLYPILMYIRFKVVMSQEQ